MSEPQCMGRAPSKDRRCRLEGRDRGDGWTGCPHHPERPRRPVGSPAMELLMDAMTREDWDSCPREIRDLVSLAWAELDEEMSDAQDDAAI